ncbi:hypothetical protein [Nonomuraea africana]|uniref:Thioredoxin domain-containing protein n=1 Tax=Nonomuraea africana TaxID=46171 RepID=A0ABR9K9T0_9ACTN|nr:hypothetical protein [Nonomuraea africana]MBE1558769.1 hypothetical protein [Nonomuraea africana]
MSLPVALSLIAVLLSVFALVAVGGLFFRLRLLERTALDPNGALFSDDVRQAPAALWPSGEQTSTLVMLLDAGCTTCHTLWEAAGTLDASDVRVVGLASGPQAAAVFEGQAELLVDPDLWTALYEGYSPTAYAIDRQGAVTGRRFVYADSDVPALLAELLPASALQGNSHAH